jgi:Ala-tRNA(Pro) deacylase
LLKLDGKSNLRLCDEATLLETCGVGKGSLSYLALLHDKDAGKVKFAIDKALLDATLINAHPLRCDRTTSVAPAGKDKTPIGVVAYTPTSPIH